MVTAYLFECRACDYSAQVCGGRDSGMEVTLLTSVCSDRDALVDVVIGPPCEEGLRMSEEDDPKLGRCSGCGGENLVPWPKSRSCPKCGARMEKGYLVSHWD